MSISQILQPNNLSVYAGKYIVPNKLVTFASKTFALGVATPILRISGLSATVPNGALSALLTLSTANAADTITAVSIGGMSFVAVQTATPVLTAHAVYTAGDALGSGGNSPVIAITYDVTVPGQADLLISVTTVGLAAPTVVNLGIQLQACNTNNVTISFL